MRSVTEEENFPKKFSSWIGFFDVIMVGANKPAFFREEGLPLYRVNVEDGTLSNLDTLSIDNDTLLKSGKVFQGGNYRTLQYLLNVPSGANDKILYVHDRIMSDTLREKHLQGWRRCLVIPDLAEEFCQQHLFEESLVDLWLLRRRVDEVESLSEHACLSSSLTADSLLAFKTDIKNRLQDLHRSFHPTWGPLLHSGFQESKLAKDVKDYCCLCTGRASNLYVLAYMHTLVPTRDVAPHDLFR